MEKSREEIKASLRDWMTATCQLMKINKKSGAKIDIEDITFWWKVTFGIRMRYKWAEKALYGRSS